MAEATAERVRLSGDILIPLANVFATNEKAQRRFRYAVIHKLTRIEALLGLVHVSQLARDQHPPQYYEHKLRKDAEASEEYVSRQSYEAGLAVVRYIYGTEGDSGAPRRGRRD